MKYVEFCYTLVTKLLTFTYLKLDSAVHCSKAYVLFVIFSYILIYQFIER